MLKSSLKNMASTEKKIKSTERLNNCAGIKFRRHGMSIDKTSCLLND